MKKIITILFFLHFIGTSIGQQASYYFPSQTGFEWKFKAIPLDSASNPINDSAYYRMDKFESVENYNGRLADIVQIKSGPLDSILFQPYQDSLFYSTEGTIGYEYFSVRNILPFLLQLDSLGIDTSFNFVDFFTALQNWYSVYRFTSGVNSEYNLVDTNVTIASYPITFDYAGKRLQDQTISTVLGNFDCKKFLLQWRIKAFTVVTLLTLSDTIWIAPDNWIVQDIIPGQYIDNLTFLGVPPFSIPGLDTRLTDEIVSVAVKKSVPNSFVLEHNYPNPFNPSTSIQYAVSNRQFVSLKVYDLLGNEVATLVNEEKPAGEYEIEFNAESLPSGIYFYQLNAGNYIDTKKMVLLK